MNILKKPPKFLILFFLTLLLSGCNANKETNSKSIRVAYFPNITHAQALIGIAEGDFQRELGDEINVEWKQFNAGPAVIEAMLAGEIDVAYLGPGPAINGFARSAGELQIIAGASSGGALLISRSDLVIKDLKELSGKKIAVPQYGNTQDLMLRNILRQHSLKDAAKGGEVQVYQAKNSDIKVLLDKKDIDLALVPEPWGSRLINEVGANVVLDYDKVFRDGKYATTVVLVKKDFLSKNPETVKKFLRAHVEVTQYINSDLDNAKKIINSQLLNLTKVSLSKAVIDSAFAKTHFTVDPEISANAEYINISRRVDYLKTDIDTSALYNLSTLNQILKAQGLAELR